MKRVLFSFLLLILLLPTGTGFAQGNPPTMDSVLIDLWPDYDQQSVLVLVTTTLPASVNLPATVSVPIPENASLHVVARFDAADGLMKDDIPFTEESGSVAITTPDRKIRIEYYIPYNSQELDRDFEFDWLSDYDVTDFQMKVQQPSAATSFAVEPSGNINIVEGDDGFVYHLLPSRAVPAGESFNVNVNYTMSSPQLSIEDLRNTITDVQTTFPETEPTVSTAPSPAGINWPIIAIAAGGVLILGALGYQLAMSRKDKSPAKSRRARSAGADRSSSQRKKRKVRPSTSVSTRGEKFCHNCGETIGSSDKFCANCGTPVKR